MHYLNTGMRSKPSKRCKGDLHFSAGKVLAKMKAFDVPNKYRDDLESAEKLLYSSIKCK